jgi:hypothetical protein
MPKQSEDLISGLHENVARLIELGALQPGEFPRWVADVNPAWSEVFPNLPIQLEILAAPQAPHDPHKRSFAHRLNWVPAAALMKAARLFERIAIRVAPDA